MASPAQLQGQWSWPKAWSPALSIGIRPCTGAIGVLIFAGLTAYDTQRLKHTYDIVAGDVVAAGRASIIGALQLYLDIEKVRFEDRLNLELDISDEAQVAMIPSLLLQPLIENAIKYGIARSEDGGTLRIAAKVFAGDLLLQLSDNGPGCALEGGEIPAAKGVGLRNTRERLAELYGYEHGFRLSKTEPHGLTISIRIPYEKR